MIDDNSTADLEMATLTGMESLGRCILAKVNSVATGRGKCAAGRLFCSVVDVAKIQTVAIIDDLDGREIDADEARTVSWTWMGIDYELDVSPTNLTRIEEGKITVAKLLSASTRVGGRRRSRATAAGATAPYSASRSAQIREWAKTNGFDVSSRGRIPAHIVDAFTSNK